MNKSQYDRSGCDTQRLQSELAPTLQLLANVKANGAKPEQIAHVEKMVAAIQSELAKRSAL